MLSFSSSVFEKKTAVIVRRFSKSLSQQMFSEIESHESFFNVPSMGEARCF